MAIRNCVITAIILTSFWACDMDKKSAKYWIDNLELESHPEGGFFKQTYKSSGIISHSALPRKYNGDRVYSTGIFFLLTTDNFSAFHRLASDEMWHHYDGAPLKVHVIHENGIYELIRLGKNFDAGETLQAVVPSGAYFASEIDADDYDFALVGCTVAPGFEYEDFELPKAEVLKKQFPQHQELIERLTRK